MELYFIVKYVCKLCGSWGGSFSYFTKYRFVYKLNMRMMKHKLSMMSGLDIFVFCTSYTRTIKKYSFR